MKASQLFTKTTKTIPADETAKNAQLLIKAGFIHKEMAGVYAYLPLGLMVLDNIKSIIRDEMNAIGGEEIIMTALQKREVWEKTDRWDDKTVDVWFKSKLKSGTDVGFGWSHEEPITAMMKPFINSYKDVPAYVYQFQTKLRNELRAKSGIMRGREFVMKDMYSYSLDDESHQKFYDGVIDAYLRVFGRVGLGEYTFTTFASGGAFTQFSHEFQTITDAGEDIIYLHRQKKLAINQEVLTDDVMNQLGVKREELEELKAAEVGNIFSFGDVKSKQLDLFYVDETGQRKPVILGSYGIGVTRLMGVIAEHFSDGKGLVWPEAVSPFRVYLVQLGEDDAVISACQEIYDSLNDSGVKVFWDDRKTRAGDKFADADLYGFPYRVIVSQKTINENCYELKKRTDDKSEQVNITQLKKVLGV